MKYLRVGRSDNWELGKSISAHLIEIDDEGKVHRIINLDRDGNLIDAAPTKSNRYGSIDHPPLSISSDWSGNEIKKDEFERLWENAIKNFG